MELVLKRDPSTTAGTAGELSIDGTFECFSYEDVCRPVKIKGDTAIPAGRYQIKITMSARFKKELPLLLNVPGFEGVRIHTGNVADDTSGCILVGQEVLADGVTHSRDAFAHLFPKLKAALAAGEEVWIEVQDA